MNTRVTALLETIHEIVGTDPEIQQEFAPALRAAAGAAGSLVKKAASPAGNTKGRIKKRFAAGGKKMIKTQKTSMADKAKARKNYRKNKSKIKMHHKKVAKTAAFKRRQAFLAKKHGR